MAGLPRALAETGGARRYVTLFEAPFQASVLTDHENNALRAGSLMAIPPPPPGSQPLAGSFGVDLLGNNLTQWASHMQEVTSHMRWPPEAAVSCPQSDIIGVLDRLEGLTRVQYCRHCFGVGQRCQCSAVPRQAPGPTAALWTPPTVTYVAMVSSTETTASTSAAGVTPLSHLPPGMPAIEPMDTLPAPTMENLLATASVGWGHKPWTPPQMPAAPGLRQMRPQMPQQQVPTPRGQEAMQATPYQQQQCHPQCQPGSQGPDRRGRRCQRKVLILRASKQATKEPILHQRIPKAPTECPKQQSDGQDGQLCGLRVEARSHPFHWLLLGGPDRFIGLG